MWPTMRGFSTNVGQSCSQTPKQIRIWFVLGELILLDISEHNLTSGYDYSGLNAQRTSFDCRVRQLALQ